MKRKKSATMASAEILPLDVMHININGCIYSFSGTSFADGLMEAIDNHVENDRDFIEYIDVSTPGGGTEHVFAPAALCAFGYLDRDDLAKHLLDTILEEDNDGTQNT